MFEVDNRMSLIQPVLEDNGFKELGNNPPTFKNENCRIEVDLENEVFHISYSDKNKVRYMLTSDNLNLYFLFGFLSANDLVSRNFRL
jgi:hypothetical protein